MAIPVFRHQYRVSYADCTLGNHVYYARYLDILEEARGEFFRNAGVSLLECQAHDVIFPVIECQLRYRAAARYDDVLTIEVRLLVVDGIRLRFGYTILGSAGRLLLEAEIAHVCTGVNERPKRLPENILRAVSPWVNPPAPSQSAATQD